MGYLRDICGIFVNLADHSLTVQSMEEERKRSEKSMLPLLSWQLTLSNIFFYFVTHSFVNMLEATVELDDPFYFFVCENIPTSSFQHPRKNIITRSSEMIDEYSTGLQQSS